MLTMGFESQFVLGERHGLVCGPYVRERGVARQLRHYLARLGLGDP